MQKMLVALLLLAAVVFAVLSLASGATYLGAVLPGGLPLGNVLAALALCAPAGAAIQFSSPGTAVRYVSWVSLVGAVVWLPASIGLAGNLALNFSGWRGSVWLAFSVAVTIAVLGALGWALIASLLARHRRTGAA